MKITKTLLFALLSLVLATLAFGQPGSIGIQYNDDAGNTALGYPCTEPRTPFPDGYSIAIFWDANLSGPDTTDIQPPQGTSGIDTCNFNGSVFNSTNMGMTPGHFLFDTYFTVYELGGAPVYYLQITRPDSAGFPGVCWQSDTFRLAPGPQDLSLTPSMWHCVDHMCHFTGTPPVAPTGVTATLDQYCLQVLVRWHHTFLNESGFNVYNGNGHVVYTALSTDSFAYVPIVTEGIQSYYVRAFNVVESDTSNHANGSTYLVRFANDDTTNIHGYDWSNRPFTVHLQQPPNRDGRCNFLARFYLLRDTTRLHTGGYDRVGTEPLCVDTTMADTMTCIFPDNSSLYYCRVLMWDSAYNTIATFTDTTDSVFHLGPIDIAGDPKLLLPDHFELAQNFPNPFNPTTEIQFSVPVQSLIRIKVYNIMGQLVSTLVQGNYEAGIHRIQWDGKSDQGIALGSGIYIYRMEGPKFVQAKKMLLLK